MAANPESTDKETKENTEQEIADENEINDDSVGLTNADDDETDTDGLTSTNEDETEPDDVSDAIDDKLSQKEDELKNEKDKYLRLAAEYDNYRKRSIKERENIYNDARAEIISRLLPVYDNLERALKTPCEDEAFYKGVELTMTQMTEILENVGVEVIQALGQTFNPTRHNAVMTIEDPNLGQKVIADEFQKGFILGEKVIRFSTVVVANT